ncbi:MAG: hypothetical protein HY618_00740 [Candidatus Tectomicrobia bacterium]|uniref:Uncharacterized protein n=1 Tax=Tectimicrobiota bacterium TaxID=2528274 RepID=A0A933E8V9_UNCTE|nr:hypothetical protein [Candidatus Tectomicrobia bacterium]
MQQKGKDVVFFDPDNGLEVPSVEGHVWQKKKKGPKYVFWDEICPFWSRGQSIVVYQQMVRNRGESRDQIASRKKEVKEKLRGCKNIHALLFHRGTARAFFVIPAGSHRKIIESRLSRFREGPWGEHFYD